MGLTEIPNTHKEEAEELTISHATEEEEEVHPSPSHALDAVKLDT